MINEQPKKYNDTDPNSTPTKWYQSVFIWVMIAMIGVAAIYISFMHNLKISTTNPEGWGQLGDFFGGVLNPVIGLATVYLLVQSVKLQRKELAETRQEIANTNSELKNQREISKQQVFEQTFFSWLNAYNDSVKSISTTSRMQSSSINMEYTYVQISGREAINGKWKYAGPHRDIISDNNFINSAVDSINSLGRTESSDDDRKNKLPIAIKELEKEYKNIASAFFSQDGIAFEPIFRNLFGLVEWIDKSENIAHQKRDEYISIVLAQISNVELEIIHAYGLTSKRAKALIEKHAMLRNLVREKRVLRVFSNFEGHFTNYYVNSAFGELKSNPWS